MAPSLPFSPVAHSLLLLAVFRTDVLQLWGPCSGVLLAWSTGSRLPSESYPCFKAPFVFFFSSRGGKWPNIPSFVLRHFAFMPVQHCLVVSSLHPCLPASLHAIFLWPCPVTVSGGVISCLSEDHLLISFLVPLIASIVPSPLIA